MKRIALFTLAVYIASIFADAIAVGSFGSISRLIGVVAFSVSIGALFTGEAVVKPEVTHALLTLFFCINAVSILWTIDSAGTIERSSNYFLELLFLWIVLQLVRSKADVQLLLKAYVTGATVAALLSLQAYRNGAAIALHTHRYSAAGADPNELALAIAMAVPMSWYLGIKLQSRLAQVFFRACPLLLILAVLLSGSRGGAIALAASLTVIPLCLKHVGRTTKVTLVVVLVAGIIAGATLVPVESLNRLSSIGDQLTRQDMAGRGEIWAAGWAQFKLHPFVGVGAGAFPAAISVSAITVMVAHNTYLSVLTELGCMGFAIWLVILLRLLHLIVRMPKPERYVWGAVFLSWAIGVFALTMEYQKISWLMFALILAHSRQSELENEQLYVEWMLEQEDSLTEVRA
jgi:O-antigen ligase